MTNTFIKKRFDMKLSLPALYTKLSLILIIVLELLFFVDTVVNAQVSSSGLAISSSIKDQDAKDGDIVCTYPDGTKRCNQEYDLSLFGVITDNPAAAMEDSDMENSRLVLRSGIAGVRVTSLAGNIKEGDFITSSTKDGVGQKAVRNGYVVGVAMEPYDDANTDNIGKIQVLLNIHPESRISGSRGNLLQFIRQGLAVPVFDPVESLRYLLAVAIVLISFTLGMIYFGRASRAGIEAIGRNPLAKRVIQLTVVLNIVLTLIIVGVGLGIAYLILVL